ncbi:MAG: hypothetical protein ABIL58_17485 [Pseudomonadota bacterium]
MEQTPLIRLMREHRTLFIVVAVGLLLLELEIFAIAVTKSGRESFLQVLDTSGNVLYETDGEQLSDFNKYYFEKTFGPLEHFQKRLQTRERPFPFRAWFAAAVGVPVGVILLIGFVFRAYVTMVFGHRKTQETAEDAPAPVGSRLGSFDNLVRTVSQYNIFIIGFIVFIGVLGIWYLPNMLNEIGKMGVETIARYKWVSISVVAVMLGLVIWVIYLRYLLARKVIDSQTEVEKYRLQLQLDPSLRNMPVLEHRPEAPIAVAALPPGDEPIPERPDRVKWNGVTDH